MYIVHSFAYLNIQYLIKYLNIQIRDSSGKMINKSRFALFLHLKSTEINRKKQI